MTIYFDSYKTGDAYWVPIISVRVSTMYKVGDIYHSYINYDGGWFWFRGL